jgi:hypothetical protein
MPWAQGDDDYLFCPIACQLDPCQAACAPSPTKVQYDGDAIPVQYRGRVMTSAHGDSTSATSCGTLHEEYNCSACWSSRDMDLFFPRFSFDVSTSAGTYRVRARYSWNGKDAGGAPVPEYSLYTTILVKLRVRVLDPVTEAELSSRDVALTYDGLNFGGFNAQCSTDYAFDVDVAIPAGSAHLVEVTALGNYE